MAAGRAALGSAHGEQPEMTQYRAWRIAAFAVTLLVLVTVVAGVIAAAAALPY
jgi:hypothetical protein